MTGRAHNHVSAGYPVEVYIEQQNEWFTAESGCQLLLLAAHHSARVGMILQPGGVRVGALTNEEARTGMINR